MKAVRDGQQRTVQRRLFGDCVTVWYLSRDVRGDELACSLRQEGAGITGLLADITQAHILSYPYT